MVMYAMNALYFDHFKHRLFDPLTLPPVDPKSNANAFDELDQTILNLAAIKPNRSDPAQSPSPTLQTTSPTVNPRYRRIALIESLRDRDQRKTTEPIYGIDHRRQFVKNRQPLPVSSFVPANWRPFKTIRYEREIVGGTGDRGDKMAGGGGERKASSGNTANTPTITPSPGSLAKMYYCVNVFYAPPPVFPPIQLFLQVGTSPDTSTSGFLHRLQFPNLIETENYLQNLRNLLLIENGNCNLKVITDISTTTTTATTPNTAGNTGGANVSGTGANTFRKPPNVPQSQSQSQSQQPPPAVQPATQYHLTPHQILQLNQQRTNSKDIQFNKQY